MSGEGGVWRGGACVEGRGLCEWGGRGVEGRGLCGGERLVCVGREGVRTCRRGNNKEHFASIYPLPSCGTGAV